MPTYVSRCEECGTEHNYIRKVAERNDTPVCCEAPTVKQLVAPEVGAMSFSGHKGVYMPDGKNGGKGTWIETGADYKNFLKKTGCVPTSDYKGEPERIRANQERENAKKRREAVVEAVKRHTT